MYTNMRFEPAGMTDDPDIRFAASLVDYIFRRLAVEYLPPDERAELGILTVDERLQPTLPGVEEATMVNESSSDLLPSLETQPTHDPQLMTEPAPRPSTAPATAPSPHVAEVPAGSRRVDAPYCYQCGMEMQRAGSCYVCSSCGSTSGCS
jgi:ribonucleoside-diphosphate reductase alpha chain